MNLQERIGKILLIGERITNIKLMSQEEIDLIRDTYFLYKGKKIERINCGACLIDAFFEFRSLTQDQIKTFMERKYRIKKGSLIDTYMSNNPDIPQGHWGDGNITDDVAKKLIKGGYGKYFIGNPTPEDIEEEEELPVVTIVTEDETPVLNLSPEKTEGQENVDESPQEVTSPQVHTEPERPISAMTKPELQALATVKNFPPDEWKNLGREKLEAYIKERI